MPYLGNRPDNVVIRNAQQEFNYTATSSQTTFTGADSNNNILAYNVGNVEVFFNGARLEEADFTATNGTSIVLASAAATNDLISVVSTDVFESTDTVSKANGGTFGSNVTVSGLLTADNISTGGYIRGPSSLTIDPATHGDNTGTVVIAGDLTVNGTTTQVNSNTVNIGDNILVLNSDEAGTPSQNSGIEIERGTSTNVAFRWNETTDKWQFTNDGSSYIDLGESDLVGDTTPQLGGDLDTNSKNIAFGDSSGATVNRLTFGAGSDLVIYHDNSTNKSHITESGTSHLIVQGQEIQFKNASGTNIMALNSAQCELFFSGSKKMETNTNGITVTGNVTNSGLVTTSGRFINATDSYDPWLKGIDASSNETSFIKKDGQGYFGGNVGIGTKTPDSKLHVFNGEASITADADADDLIVENNGAAGITIGSSASSVGSIRFADSSQPRSGMVYYSHITNEMRFYTNQAQAMTILSSGSVGIGIASPGTSLHVKDAITNPNTISSNLTIPASSNSLMAGPITLNATVTIPSGSSWTIV